MPNYPHVTAAELFVTASTLECEIERLRSSHPSASEPQKPTYMVDMLNRRMNKLIHDIRTTIDPNWNIAFRLSQLAGKLSIATDEYGGARVGTIKSENQLEVQWHKSVPRGALLLCAMKLGFIVNYENDIAIIEVSDEEGNNTFHVTVTEVK